jgi:hypothetical protein
MMCLLLPTLALLEVAINLDLWSCDQLTAQINLCVGDLLLFGDCKRYNDAYNSRCRY